MLKYIFKHTHKDYQMYLKRIVIKNFRGVRYLDLDLEQDRNILIGENTWGKSSALAALWMILGQDPEHECTFSKEDIYKPFEKKAFSYNYHKESVSLDASDFESATQDKDYQANHDDMFLSAYDNGLAIDDDFIKKQQDAFSAIDKDNFLEYFGDIETNNLVSNTDSTDELSKKNISTYIENSSDDHESELSKKLNSDSVGFDKKPNDSTPDKNFSEFITYNEERYRKFKDNDVICHAQSGIDIELYFVINDLDNVNPIYYAKLEKYININKDNEKVIFYRVQTHESGGQLATFHNLINSNGSPFFKVDGAKRIIRKLFPLFRLRDSRMGVRGSYNSNFHVPSIKLNNYRFGNISDVCNTNDIAVRSLLEFAEKYFSQYCIDNSQHSSSINSSGCERHFLPNSKMTDQIFTELLKLPKDDLLKLILYINQDFKDIDPCAYPIVIIEDMESRLYPTLLAKLWDIFCKVDAQILVTTNSSKLVSESECRYIRRLFKGTYDVCSFKIDENQFANTDLRKIYYQIFTNKPDAVFAKVWLLVEGQSEVWLFKKAAKVLGFSLSSAGIEVVEYAQCSISPLIKLALNLGINFIVLADGDSAGQKTYDKVAQIYGRQTSILYKLKENDIEHFLYEHNFHNVYKESANVSEDTSSVVTNANSVVESQGNDFLDKDLLNKFESRFSVKDTFSKDNLEKDIKQCLGNVKDTSIFDFNMQFVKHDIISAYILEIGKLFTDNDQKQLLIAYANKVLGSIKAKHNIQQDAPLSDAVNACYSLMTQAKSKSSVSIKELNFLYAWFLRYISLMFDPSASAAKKSKGKVQKKLEESYIEKAIKKHSKPDMMIKVCAEMEKQNMVPKLIETILLYARYLAYAPEIVSLELKRKAT